MRNKINIVKFLILNCKIDRSPSNSISLKNERRTMSLIHTQILSLLEMVQKSSSKSTIRVTAKRLLVNIKSNTLQELISIRTTHRERNLYLKQLSLICTKIIKANE